MKRIAAMATAVGVSVGLVCAAQAQQAAIGTLPQGSLGYAIAAAAASVISKHSGITATAVPTGGSSVVLPQVARGEMEFGTSNTVEAVYVHRGTGNFEGKPLDKLRVAAMLTPFRVGILVRQDSDIKTAADLKGRPFPTDYSAQRLVGFLLEAALAAEGLNLDHFERVPVPNFVRGVELLTAGRVAGAFAAPGSGIIRQADASVGIRFIGIRDKGGGEAKAQALAPGSYLVEVEPSPANAGVKEPAKMLGYEYTLMVGAHVPDDIVYRAVKALHQNPKDLAAAHGAFRGWKAERIFMPLAAPYHPGAEKYFKEAGLWRK